MTKENPGENERTEKPDRSFNNFSAAITKNYVVQKWGWAIFKALKSELFCREEGEVSARLYELRLSASPSDALTKKKKENSRHKQRYEVLRKITF